MSVIRLPSPRKPGPPYKGPFPDVPSGNGLFIYAIEFTDGLVKVGKTFAPRSRLEQHLRARATRGVSITRYVVARAAHRQCGWTTERHLLERMDRLGERIGPKAETYMYVSFGAAANLVKQISRREFVSYIPQRKVAA